MTNHDRFASVFRNRMGQTFQTEEIEKLMLAESDIQPGSISPKAFEPQFQHAPSVLFHHDHGGGNKGQCACIGTGAAMLAGQSGACGRGKRLFVSAKSQ